LNPRQGDASSEAVADRSPSDEPKIGADQALEARKINDKASTFISGA
jgi:hypothetical protein